MTDDGTEQVSTYIRSDILLPLKEGLQLPNYPREPISSTIIPDDALPDPSRQLGFDPRRGVAPVQQQHAGVVAPVPDGAADALVHGAHAGVFGEVPSGRFAILVFFSMMVVAARARRPFDVLEFGFPGRGAEVGEGEADDGDGAAEGVGEVDAFGEGAADDGEEEGAFVAVAGAGAGGDGLGVLVQDVVGVGTAGGIGGGGF